MVTPSTPAPVGSAEEKHWHLRDFPTSKGGHSRAMNLRRRPGILSAFAIATRVDR
jgi:hypothetical protein